MAYSITCDGHPLLDLRDDEKYIVTNPKCKLEVNTVGEASFTIYNNHPHYTKLKKMKSIFEISDDIGVIFRGRMTDDTIDFNLGKAVDLEGAMAFFNDSIIRPFTFPDDFLGNDAYIAASESGNVIDFFLDWVISEHNNQVQPFQQLKKGNVTVADPNNYLSRSNEEIASTWDVLKGKLFDSALGGYLCARYEEDGTYIDYLADFETINTQEIVFGENLIDLTSNTDANSTYTVIIPRGAEIEVEETVENTPAPVDEVIEDDEITDGDDPEEFPEEEIPEVEIPEEPTTIVTKQIVTIEGLEDGDVTDDIVKVGDMLYSRSGVETYGWIVAPLSETKWDDVTDATNLLRKAVTYLAGTAIKLTNTIDIKAVDLHFTDEEIQSFRIYKYVNVKSEPHNHQDKYKLTKLEIDLMNPQNTSIVLGDSQRSLIDSNVGENNTIKDRVEKVEQNYVKNETLVNEAAELQSLINQTMTEILMNVSESYSSKSSVEELNQKISTTFKQTSEEISFMFSTLSEKITNENGELVRELDELHKYVRIVDGEIHLGEINNPLLTKVKNGRFAIELNNVEVAYLSDNKLYITDAEILTSIIIGNFAFKPRKNGNLSFLKVR